MRRWVRGSNLPPPAPPGAVLYYTGENEAWAGTIKDRSGYNNTGTLTNGATWVRANSVWANSFDGANDAILANHSTSLAISGAISLGIWCKIDVTQAEDFIAIGKFKYTAAADAGGYALTWNVANGYIYLALRNNLTVANVAQSANGSVLADDKWYFYGATWPGTGVGIVYLNGVDATSATAAFNTTILDKADKFSIGAYYSTAASRLKGQAAFGFVCSGVLTPAYYKYFYESTRRLLGV